MAAADFFTESAHQKAAETVAAIESQAGAEVVIAVTRVSGSYRAADYLGGFIAALLVLSVLIFHPQPFDESFFPLEVLLAFVVGAVFTTNLDPLRRFLAGAKVRAEQVKRSARASFHDQGITRTRARS